MEEKTPSYEQIMGELNIPIIRDICHLKSVKSLKSEIMKVKIRLNPKNKKIIISLSIYPTGVYRFLSIRNHLNNTFTKYILKGGILTH